MRGKQDPYETKHLCSRWAGSRWPRPQRERHPAKHSTRASPPPSCGKKRLCPRGNLTFYKQIPNSPMHTRVAVTSFPCQRRGGPRPAHVLLSLLFDVRPCSLWRARSFPEFHRPPQAGVLLTAGRSAVRLWRGGLQQQLTAQGSREEPEAEGMGHFPRFCIGQFTIPDFSYSGDPF